MKRSDFAEIVNAVSQEEAVRLQKAMQEAASSDQNALAEMLAQVAVSVPDVAARTTAEILVRSGLLSLESDP